MLRRWRLLASCAARIPVGAGAIALAAGCAGSDAGAGRTGVVAPDGGKMSAVAPDGGTPGNAGAGDGSDGKDAGASDAASQNLGASDAAALTRFGDVHTGEYELGPVEWTGSFNNSCAPYPNAVEQIEGDYLAGLDSSFNGDGSLCDACIAMTTAKGKSLVLRVVTNGASAAATNADVSQAAFDQLSSGEYPRTMTWQLVACPGAATIEYQYQTEASADWTSLWVRDARVPVAKVEVTSARHASWFALTRGSDGTLTDSGGFGAGTFSIRVTGIDGQTVTDTFASFLPGALVASTQQLD